MFYSVRMRASLKGKHISGQERIVKKEDLEKVLIELYRRPKEDWDFLNLKVEKLTSPPRGNRQSFARKEFFLSRY